MFTRKTLTSHIDGFLADIKAAGYSPTRAVLFGSYANGNPHEHSDIDLAVWDNKFTGCGTVDVVPIASIIGRYPLLELHPFNSDDLDNPFAQEIIKKGKLVYLSPQPFLNQSAQ